VETDCSSEMLIIIRLHDVATWKATVQNFIIVKMPYFDVLNKHFCPIFDCVIRDKVFFRFPGRYYVISAI
jgi:hypothetical protein